MGGRRMRGYLALADAAAGDAALRARLTARDFVATLPPK
jgi:hypothetical protein